jgi:ADP-ribose pyrophosphatase YjhB (NUDIX family)
MKKFRKNSAVIIKNNDEVLLCKRSPKETLPNIWSIPGGGMEDGESPGQTAIRETYEETNIEIGTNIDLVGIIDIFNDNKVKRGIMFVFLYETKEKLIPNLEKASHGFEHTKCKYFKSEDIPKQKGKDQLYDILKKVLK